MANSTIELIITMLDFGKFKSDFKANSLSLVTKQGVFMQHFKSEIISKIESLDGRFPSNEVLLKIRFEFDSKHVDTIKNMVSVYTNNFEIS